MSGSQNAQDRHTDKETYRAQAGGLSQIHTTGLPRRMGNELQQDLLAVMVIMAGGRFPEKLVIRRERVMESPIFQEWVMEERRETEARGEVRGRQDSICEYLEVRFGPAAAELQRQVRSISSLDELDRIINNIYTTETIEEAQGVILGTRN